MKIKDTEKFDETVKSLRLAMEQQRKTIDKFKMYASNERDYIFVSLLEQSVVNGAILTTILGAARNGEFLDDDVENLTTATTLALNNLGSLLNSYSDDSNES